MKYTENYTFQIDEIPEYKVHYHYDYCYMYFKVVMLLDNDRVFIEGYLKDQGDTVVIDQFTDYIHNKEMFNDLDPIITSIQKQYKECFNLDPLND